MTLPQISCVMGFTGTRFPPGSDTRAAVLSCRIPCFTSNMPYYMHVLEVANLRTPCTGASTLSLFLSTADRILHWPLPPFAVHQHLAPKCFYFVSPRVACDTTLLRDHVALSQRDTSFFFVRIFPTETLLQLDWITVLISSQLSTCYTTP